MSCSEGIDKKNINKLYYFEKYSILTQKYVLVILIQNLNVKVQFLNLFNNTASTGNFIASKDMDM
jgi:hypothetical protein